MDIEQWKLKRLITSLNNMSGNGTSMISLIIPASSTGYEGIARVVKMLSDEIGTASNIKSRVNRLSVQSAITSAIQKLKTYDRVPVNGLVLYYGTTYDDNIGEKRVSIAFSPYRPILTKLYLCDSKFHTEDLIPLLVSEDKYGFIIIDGSGILFAVLQGDLKTIIRKYDVDLPKKHSKGGQSSQRFGRIRMEKRQAYVTKVAEFVNLDFLTNDVPNVKGIIIAGSADFKFQLQEFLDARILKIILGCLDVSYGGENGLAQAISLSAQIIKNTRYVHEKNLIQKYMSEISMNTGKICYGIKDVMYALKEGCIETLIVWENLPLIRIENKEEVEYVNELKEGISENNMLFVDWIATNYKDFGCSLEIISDASSEGRQFVMGFGGLGGILRYPLDFNADEIDVIASQRPIDYDEDFM